MKYLISTDGWKESCFDFIVENKEDIIKIVELYCDEWGEDLKEGSFDINWSAKKFSFSLRDSYTSPKEDWEVYNWKLIPLYNPHEETKLYPK
jgi:hypothetical protein